MNQTGVTPESFKGGRNSFAQIFRKVAAGEIVPPTKTVRTCALSTDGWCTKTASPAVVAAAALLQPLLAELCAFYDEQRPAVEHGGTAARKGLRDRERGLHDPRPAAQVAAAHRRHAPCDGRRNGRRRRPGVGQGHDHGASGLRGARGRHLRLRRGAYLPSCGQEIIQNLQFRIQNCLYLYDQTPNRDAYEAVENNLSTPCLRAHDI